MHTHARTHTHTHTHTNTHILPTKRVPGHAVTKQDTIQNLLFRTCTTVENTLGVTGSTEIVIDYTRLLDWKCGVTKCWVLGDNESRVTLQCEVSTGIGPYVVSACYVLQ